MAVTTTTEKIKLSLMLKKELLALDKKLQGNGFSITARYFSLMGLIHINIRYLKKSRANLIRLVKVLDILKKVLGGGYLIATFRIQHGLNVIKIYSYDCSQSSVLKIVNLVKTRLLRLIDKILNK